MSGNQSKIYGSIIIEQILLQELQNIARHIECEIGDETELLTVGRKIKRQRMLLNRLWAEARALEDGG